MSHLFKSEQLRLEQAMVVEAQKIIDQKTKIDAALSVGQLFRDQAELLDVKDWLTKHASKALMWGVCGGRLEYHTPFRHKARIAVDLGMLAPKLDLDDLLAHFPANSRDLHTALAVKNGFTDPSFWWDRFVQDFDLCVVTADPYAHNDNFVERGRRSDIKMDIFVVTPATVCEPNEGYGSRAFRQAVQLAF